MSLLAIKLLVTPLVVLLASLAARRWGDAVGGWLVGLPLTSVPVSVFLAIEQGPSFAGSGGQWIDRRRRAGYGHARNAEHALLRRDILRDCRRSSATADVALLAAFALATTGGLIAQGATLHLVRRPPKMEDAAEEEPAASSLHRG